MTDDIQNAIRIALERLEEDELQRQRIYRLTWAILAFGLLLALSGIVALIMWS